MSLSSRRVRSARPIGVGAHRPVRWLCGALIAGCSLLGQAAARPSHPYLAVASPLPLRFAPPPPERGTEPTPLATTPAGIAVAEIPSIQAEPLSPTVSDAGLPTSSPGIIPEQSEAEASADPLHAYPPPTSPPAILPDDLSQRTTAEDFLPYFLPPRLPSAPPSQATYQQR